MLRYVDAALERSDSDYPPPVSNHTRQAGQQRPGPGIPAVIKAPRCASTGRIAGWTAPGLVLLLACRANSSTAWPRPSSAWSCVLTSAARCRIPELGHVVTPSVSAGR